MKDLRISVQDLAGIDMLRPVCGGVPIAEGAAPEGATFVLHDESGTAIPLQASVLARWKDRSARWVLLDFQSRPRVHGRLGYLLSWGRGALPSAPHAPVVAHPGDRPVLSSGSLRVSRLDGALLDLSGRFALELRLVDAQGRHCNATIEDAGIDTAGHLRSTL